MTIEEFTLSPDRVGGLMWEPDVETIPTQAL